MYSMEQETMMGQRSGESRDRKERMRILYWSKGLRREQGEVR